jgi:hypothetical protein
MLLLPQFLSSNFLLQSCGKYTEPLPYSTTANLNKNRRDLLCRHSKQHYDNHKPRTCRPCWRGTSAGPPRQRTLTPLPSAVASETHPPAPQCGGACSSSSSSSRHAMSAADTVWCCFTHSRFRFAAFVWIGNGNVGAALLLVLFRCWEPRNPTVSAHSMLSTSCAAGWVEMSCVQHVHAVIEDRQLHVPPASQVATACVTHVALVLPAGCVSAARAVYWLDTCCC